MSVAYRPEVERQALKMNNFYRETNVPQMDMILESHSSQKPLLHLYHLLHLLHLFPLLLLHPLQYPLQKKISSGEDVLCFFFQRYIKIQPQLEGKNQKKKYVDCVVCCVFIPKI